MKKQSVLVGLCAVGSLTATTISSTSSGGLWSDTLTWVGYTIPGASDDVVINGTVSLDSRKSCNSLTVADGAVFQNGGSLGWTTLTVENTITNNGTIRNNPEKNTLNLELNGDIINNGYWKIEWTRLTTKRTQTISQKAGTFFKGSFSYYSVDGMQDTTKLIAGSDLAFDSASVESQYYNSTTGKYLWRTIDLNGHNLTIDNKTEFFRAVLTGMDTLTVLDSSHISDLYVESAITLAGETNFRSTCTFNGTTTVAGTIQNFGSLGWVTPTFNGAIINNGTIRSNPGGNEFWLDLRGDITNNGLWKPAKTMIPSVKVQTISQTADKKFEGIFVRSPQSGACDSFPLVAGSDLTFDVPSYDGMSYNAGYFWSIFDMNHYNLVLSGATSFGRTIFKNTASIESRDSATIYDLSFEGSVTLLGTTTCTNSEINFGKELSNEGILQNGGNLGWLTIKAQGGIINLGTIRNNPKGNELWINIGGYIHNGGSWTNGQNTLIDSVNQYVELAQPILAKTRFQCEWPSSPYAWMKDAQEMILSYDRLLSFDSLTTVHFGSYQCSNADTLSRVIYLSANFLPITPRVILSSAKSIGLIQVVSSNAVRLNAKQPITYTLSLVDLHGRVVAGSEGTLEAGNHIVPLNRTVAAGVYVVRLTANNQQFVSKLLFDGQ